MTGKYMYACAHVHVFQVRLNIHIATTPNIQCANSDLIINIIIYIYMYMHN